MARDIKVVKLPPVTEIRVLGLAPDGYYILNADEAESLYSQLRDALGKEEK